MLGFSEEGEVSPRSYRKSVKNRAAAAGRFRILLQNAHRQAMPGCTPSPRGLRSP